MKSALDAAPPWQVGSGPFTANNACLPTAALVGAGADCTKGLLLSFFTGMKQLSHRPRASDLQLQCCY